MEKSPISPVHSSKNNSRILRYFLGDRFREIYTVCFLHSYHKSTTTGDINYVTILNVFSICRDILTQGCNWYHDFIRSGKRVIIIAAVRGDYAKYLRTLAEMDRE